MASRSARGAWRWEENHWHRLANGDWFPPDNPGWLQALGISSLGHVAGYADGLDLTQVGHAWVYDPTHRLPAAPDGDLDARDLHLSFNFSSTDGYSRATGVNQWGHVVGWRREARLTGMARAWLLARGQVVDLGLVSSAAFASLKINDAGDIVAQDFNAVPGGLPRPGLLRPDGLARSGLGPGRTGEPAYDHHRWFLLEDLVVGGLEAGIALETVSAINQAGVIAGTARVLAGGGVRHPYLLVPVAATGNQPPVAVDDTVTRYADRVMISVTQRLLSNDRDPDAGDVLRLVGCDTRSFYGGTVVQQGDWILYTPGENFTGEDRFDYTLSDQRGGMASATVFIQPEETPLQPAVNQIITVQEPGTVPAVRFRGEPFEIYRIEASDTAQPGGWELLAERTAEADGLISILDPSAIFRPKRFYQAVQP